MVGGDPMTALLGQPKKNKSPEGGLAFAELISYVAHEDAVELFHMSDFFQFGLPRPSRRRCQSASSKSDPQQRIFLFEVGRVEALGELMSAGIEGRGEQSDDPSSIGWKAFAARGKLSCRNRRRL